MRSWVLEPVASSRTAYCVLRCCTVDSCGAPGMELFLAALLNAWPPAFAGVPTVPPDVHVHICVAKTRLPLITRHRDLGALHVVVIDQRPCLRTTDTLPPSVNQVIEPRDMAGPESTAVWMNCYTSTATWIKCHHQHHGWGGSSGVGVGDGSDSQHQPGYTWGIDANQTAWMQAMRGPSIPGIVVVLHLPIPSAHPPLNQAYTVAPRDPPVSMVGACLAPHRTRARPVVRTAVFTASVSRYMQCLA